MKIYHIITSPKDNLLLQDDINHLSNWCNINNLFLIIKKWKFMTFSTNRNPISYNYYLNNIILDPCFRRKYLGIYFNPSLTFNDHYIHIQNKLSSMLDGTRKDFDGT